jgi:formylglycine-generating enzyme required for sulfatase activity
LDTQEVAVALEKTYVIVVRVVNFQGNKPIKDVNVKVFRLEKTPITLKQWAENLKNGTPFKKLILSMNTDNNGNVTAELAEGSYEVKVEKYGLNKACELTQNDRVLFIEPKKHWWQ